jgi:hypothetical protein
MRKGRPANGLFLLTAAMANFVEIRTSRGVSRVMLFSKAIIQAE